MAQLVSSILPKDGYHPTSVTKISFKDSAPSALSDCSLHLHFVLPPLIFVDPYELADYEDSYTFTRWGGSSNLELPVVAVPRENASLLLNVKAPLDIRGVQVNLPLHLRYGDLAGGSSGGYNTVEVPWPTGFLSCPQSGPFADASDLLSVPNEIASRFDLSAVRLLPLSPFGSGFSETVRVPVGDLADLAYVEAGTALTIIVSFCYLLHISWLVVRRNSRAEEIRKVD